MWPSETDPVQFTANSSVQMKETVHQNFHDDKRYGYTTGYDYLAANWGRLFRACRERVEDEQGGGMIDRVEDEEVAVGMIERVEDEEVGMIERGEELGGVVTSPSAGRRVEADVLLDHAVLGAEPGPRSEVEESQSEQWGAWKFELIGPEDLQPRRSPSSPVTGPQNDGGAPIISASVEDQGSSARTASAPVGASSRHQQVASVRQLAQTKASVGQPARTDGCVRGICLRRWRRSS